MSRILTAILALCVATPLAAQDTSITCERLPRNAGVIDVQSYLITDDKQAIILPLTANTTITGNRNGSVTVSSRTFDSVVTHVEFQSISLRDFSAMLADC